MRPPLRGILLAAATFTAGLVLGKTVSAEPLLLYVGACLLLIAGLLFARSRRLIPLQDLAFLLLWLLLGLFRGSVLPGYTTPEGQVWIKGTVAGTVEEREDYVRFRLIGVQWERNSNQGDLEGDALVYLQKRDAIELHPGDGVKLLGRVGLFTPPRNPGGFHARAYWRLRGVPFRVDGMGYATRIVPEHTELTLWSHFRQAAINHLASALPAHQHPAALSLLAGERSLWSEEFREELARSGLLHLFAISGLHTGLLAGMLLVLLRVIGLPWKWAYGISIVLIWCYAPFTGGQPPVLRAAVLYTMLAGGKMLQRRYDSAYALLLGWILLLFWRPWGLWDVGFQLSFAGAAGVIAATKTLALVPRTKKNVVFPWYLRWPKNGLEWAGRLAIFSLCAWLATAPLVIFHFGRLSFAGFPLLVLAMPVVTLALVAGWLTLLAGWIPLLGVIFTAAFSACIEVLLALVFLGDGLNLVWQPLPAFALWPAGLFAIVFFLSLPRLREAPLPTATLLVVLAGLVIVGTRLAWIHQPARLIVADVGQGDGIVLCQGEKAVVIDTGPPDNRALEDVLTYYGIRRVPLVFLTHGDRDHAGGLAALLDHVPVKHILTSAATLQDPLNADLPSAIHAKGQPLCWMGTSSTRAEVKRIGLFEVLHPSEETRSATMLSDNDGSLVVLFSRQSEDSHDDPFRALFPGDISSVMETRILQTTSVPRVDLLLAAHHGSGYSTSREWLTALQPGEVVVSCGRNNTFGHPAPRVLHLLEEMGIPHWRTDMKHARIIQL